MLQEVANIYSLFQPPNKNPIICLDKFNFVQEMTWMTSSPSEKAFYIPKHKCIINMICITINLFSGHDISPFLWKNLPYYFMQHQVCSLERRNAHCALEGGMLDCSQGLQILRFPASILVQLLLALSYVLFTNIPVVVNLSFLHMNKIFASHLDYFFICYLI